MDLWSLAEGDVLGYIEKAAQRHRLKKLGLDDGIPYSFECDQVQVVPVFDGNVIKGDTAPVGSTRASDGASTVSGWVRTDSQAGLYIASSVSRSFCAGGPAPATADLRGMPERSGLDEELQAGRCLDDRLELLLVRRHV